MRWPYLILKVFNFAAGAAYALGVVNGVVLLLAASFFLVIGGIPGPHGGPPFLVRDWLTAAGILLPIIGACVYLAYAHLRAGGRPSRWLLGFSAGMTGLLVLLIVAVLCMPRGSIPLLDTGDEVFASLVIGLVALVYAAYALLNGWLLRRVAQLKATDTELA